VQNDSVKFKIKIQSPRDNEMVTKLFRYEIVL